MKQAHTLSEEAVARIVAEARWASRVIPHPELSALRLELDQIAQAHIRYLQTRPSCKPLDPARAERRLRQIANEVAWLEREVSSDGVRPWLEMIDLIPHEKKRLQFLRGKQVKLPLRFLTDTKRSLKALAFLTERSAEFAQLMRKHAAEGGGDRRSGYSQWKADPLREWRSSWFDRITAYSALARTYRKHFKRRFVAHRARSGKADFGPAVRFVRAFFSELHKIDSRAEVPTGHAVQSWLKSHMGKKQGGPHAPLIIGPPGRPAA
jgi:hypothetical protein